MPSIGNDSDTYSHAPEEPPRAATGPFHRHDSLTWLPSASMARRKRRIYVIVQAVLAALVGFSGAVFAHLMLLSWPGSLGQVRQTAIDVVSPALALVRVPFAPEFVPFLPVTLLATVIYPAVLYGFRFLSAPAGTIAPFGNMWGVCKAVTCATVGLYVLGAPALSNAFPGNHYRVILFFVYLGATTLFGSLLYRSGFLSVVYFLRSAGIGHTRIAIVTPGDPAELREVLDRHESDYKLVGTISLEPADNGGPAARRDRLGALADLQHIINRESLDEVLLAVDPGVLTVEHRLALVENCWKLGTDLKMVAPFHPYFRTSAQSEFLGDITLLRIAPLGLYATHAQAVKRTIDVGVALGVLLVASPVMALAAVLIKLTSPGPVLFIQERAGLHGRVFRIYKFRTMRPGAATDEHRDAQRRLIQEGAPAGVDPDGQPIYGKVANDPRVTPLGQWLRRTSIDELPQLWNILRGEMSLVGPRPAVQTDVESFKAWHFQRHGIRPGLTGLWQVSGRSRLSFDRMVELDLKYIEDWSIWLDLRILLKTIPTVLRIDRAF